jgi:hypothetical protein
MSSLTLILFTFNDGAEAKIYIALVGDQIVAVCSGNKLACSPCRFHLNDFCSNTRSYLLNKAALMTKYGDASYIDDD